MKEKIQPSRHFENALFVHFIEKKRFLVEKNNYSIIL